MGLKTPLYYGATRVTADRADGPPRRSPPGRPRPPASRRARCLALTWLLSAHEEIHRGICPANPTFHRDAQDRLALYPTGAQSEDPRGMCRHFRGGLWRGGGRKRLCLSRLQDMWLRQRPVVRPSPSPTRDTHLPSFVWLYETITRSARGHVKAAARWPVGQPGPNRRRRVVGESRDRAEHSDRHAASRQASGRSELTTMLIVVMALPPQRGRPRRPPVWERRGATRNARRRRDDSIRPSR
jgi:hypothetical protein